MNFAVCKHTGPPKAPKNCSVAISTASYVRLNVEPPSETGGFALTGYVVNFRLRNADGSMSSTSSDPISFKMGETIEMRGLKPQTEYRFQVAAKNRIGVGAQTECVHTTPDVGPPSPPEITSLRLSSASNSYELTWNLENDGGLPISQYLIRFRQVLYLLCTLDLHKCTRLASSMHLKIHTPFLF